MNDKDFDAASAFWLVGLGGAVLASHMMFDAFKRMSAVGGMKTMTGPFAAGWNLGETVPAAVAPTPEPEPEAPKAKAPKTKASSAKTLGEKVEAVALKAWEPRVVPAAEPAPTELANPVAEVIEATAVIAGQSPRTVEEMMAVAAEEVAEEPAEEVSEEPAEDAPAVAARPTALVAAREGGADDLKLIKGVGPKLEILLNGLGYYHFDQIAAWGAEELAEVDASIDGFTGRATRDGWVEQAKTLAAGGTV